VALQKYQLVTPDIDDGDYRFIVKPDVSYSRVIHSPFHIFTVIHNFFFSNSERRLSQHHVDDRRTPYLCRIGAHKGRKTTFAAIEYSSVVCAQYRITTSSCVGLTLANNQLAHRSFAARKETLPSQGTHNTHRVGRHTHTPERWHVKLVRGQGHFKSS